jgi:hypothetical protein
MLTKLCREFGRPFSRHRVMLLLLNDLGGVNLSAIPQIFHRMATGRESDSPSVHDPVKLLNKCAVQTASIPLLIEVILSYRYPVLGKYHVVRHVPGSVIDDVGSLIQVVHCGRERLCRLTTIVIGTIGGFTNLLVRPSCSVSP